ncbi:Helicase loader DnaI [uncultured Gammaproteobacteria bacterium]|nr:Helicase loader DnaI [uncultured Gammaproteobacteria bacterium]
MQLFEIVTDYRLNANHNKMNNIKRTIRIVTDYRLNANHN